MEGEDEGQALTEEYGYEFEYSKDRKKQGTFRATCTRFLTLIFSLVMLALCAVALLFYQELPVGHYQDLDSVTMLYDHRKAHGGINAEHDNFRKESWKREVDVSSFLDDVERVSEHIPVALYCGGTASLCEVEFEVPCLSDLTAVNMTHSKGTNDNIEVGINLFSTCNDFNTLSWQDKAGRLRVLYHALTGTYVTIKLDADQTERDSWDQWTCDGVNFAQMQTVSTACTRKIDLCVPTTQALTSMKTSPSALDFFRLAKSNACAKGPNIEVYYKSRSVSTLDLASRDHGWISAMEVEAFFNQSFAQIFGEGTTEPYGRASISSMLLVEGKGMDFNFITKSAGDMKTAKYVGDIASQVSIASVPASCPNTGHDIFYGVGSVDVQLEVFNSSEVAMVTVSVGSSVKYVPQYEVTADSDWTTLDTKRISSMDIRVTRSAVSNVWGISELTGKYESADLTDTNIKLQVELHDVSEPQELYLPILEMEYYTMTALAIAAVAGIIVFILPFILYHEYKQGLLANGLPLPFFRYTTQFRGW